MGASGKPDRAAWIAGPEATCTPKPQNLAEPWRLILLGPPGVGKGTQADLLHQKLHACHVSTGDVFRAAAGRSECEQTPAIRAALEYMRRGDLVPDSIVWEKVLERSGCLRCGGGFLLDGFPRTLAQAESLKHLMENQGLYLSAVLVVLGFITNRMNVSITGFEGSTGVRYFPKWSELAVTGMIIGSGFALFGLAVKYLPIFPKEELAHETASEPEEVVPVTSGVLEHAGD